MLIASDDDPQDHPPALGTVVEEERGSLPFALIHGEALVACAVWALADAGVTPVDLGTQWAGLVDSGEAFVLHDSLCPMTPAPFISECVRTSLDLDLVVVGEVDGVVASPVVLPPSVVGALGGDLPLDFEALVTRLRRDFTIHPLAAPPAARRVASVADVADLERETSAPED